MYTRIIRILLSYSVYCFDYKMRVLVVLCIILQVVLGKRGFGPTDQEWGFSEVRPGANLFWWLHYTTADVSTPTDRPLLIWLQGGPGSSSTGYGNFEELGPLDSDLNPRNTTWVQWANVLFVDNPVGTGFGYVTSDDLYAKNNTQIATDFLEFMKDFYKQLPKFKTVPLYIFCESYGGKMAAEIALVLYQAIQKGEIESNLKGVALGDSWISPLDAELSYGPYLFNLGFIDRNGYDAIMEEAARVKKAIDKGDFDEALSLWYSMESLVEVETRGIDWYNVFTGRVSNNIRGLDKQNTGASSVTDDLATIMNSKVAPALNITKEWVDQRSEVFDSLGNDFMRPVTHIVEELLNTTDLIVAVYNGQLDLIVDTPATYNWVENIAFKGKDEWEHAERIEIYNAVDYIQQGFYKRANKFAFYWVNLAGHMVPHDNPTAMEFILRDVTDNFKV
uniref:Retinoid-inducible serine carboxypeptidase n=1 Tax=Diabrotica virgifera virgifera TaxID=50390 RepID=A0A6P7FN15_DIAVI